MDEHSQNVYNGLMKLCPEAIKPFAEAMLPMAIQQMDEQQKLDLEAKLDEFKDRSEVDQAEMLIAFAKALGADPSMFAMVPELQGYAF